MARPIKLTNEVEEKIIMAIRAGNYAHVAAQSGGIDPATYYRWKKRGDPAGTNPADSRYRTFRARIEQAEAQAEVLHVASIAKAGERDWHARKFLLERRHPERWARRAPAEEEGSVLERSLAATGSGYRLSALSEPEQAELARLLDSARVGESGKGVGPVTPLPSGSDMWEQQVLRRLEGHPELKQRFTRGSLALYRTEPDRHGEAVDELLDEIAEELGLAPRPGKAEST